ncbi:MAG: GspE/PulE family protein, partial [Verrucomicrobiae bacterium]
MDAKQVTEIFTERGLITQEQAAAFIQEAAASEKPIERILVEHSVVEEDGFIQVIADSIGAEAYNLNEFAPDTTVLGLIPSGLARLHGAMPIMGSGNTIIVTLTDPLNPQTIEDLRFALGREIQVMVAFPSKVKALITRHYGSEVTNFDDIIAQLGAGSDLLVTGGAGDTFNLQAVAAEANTGPIIKYVDLILDKAIAARASDIHFEPFETEFKIRYRVDGALYEMDPPPLHLALPVISRVKVMSNLNIAERRLPQDGRIQRTIGGRQVDLRVSTLPTTFGESVVLRVLDRSSVNLDLETLGMPEGIYNYILHVIEKPNGIFIVTGPTGSGKTTTLYSCLRKINTIDSKLLTAEDPVEYEIDGIIQVPINEGIGLNFARVLRAFLRQDPDRILVGETRDIETAQIAI